MSMLRNLIGQESLRAAGLNYLSKPLCSSLIVTNDQVIYLHAWARHPLRTLCCAIPRGTTPSGLHVLLLVGGLRRRSLEDWLYLQCRRSAMTLRRPLRLQPLRKVPRFRLFLMGLPAAEL
jgi:hypothetical protein